MKKHFFGLALLAVVSMPAYAEGIYVFADIGNSKFSLDTTEDDLSKTDTARALGLGYALSKTFAFEVAYRDFGSVISYNILLSGSAHVDEHAINASVITKYPINDAVDIFGRLGAAKLTIDDEYRSSPSPEDNYSTSTSGTKVFYGVGATYSIDNHFGLRAEYNRYAEFQNLTTSTLTFGAVYSF